LAFAGLYLGIQITPIEKFPMKPFNPLLGETYELVKPGKFTFITEQVCHHPPITAYENRGDSGYVRYGTMRVKTSFSKGALSFSNTHKEYLEFPKFGEKFEFIPAVKSIHNLIIGQPYIEVSGKSYLMNQACPKDQYVEIEYFKRGWSSESAHRIVGTVYEKAGQVAYRFEGRFTKEVTLVNAKIGVKEYTWTKQPYPENWEYMYGMT
jgi:hypothetical protein